MEESDQWKEYKFPQNTQCPPVHFAVTSRILVLFSVLYGVSKNVLVFFSVSKNDTRKSDLVLFSGLNSVLVLFSKAYAEFMSLGSPETCASKWYLESSCNLYST